MCGQVPTASGRYIVSNPPVPTKVISQELSERFPQYKFPSGKDDDSTEFSYDVSKVHQLSNTQHYFVSKKVASSRLYCYSELQGRAAVQCDNRQMFVLPISDCLVVYWHDLKIEAQVSTSLQ